jgi:hypothetical protein
MNNGKRFDIVVKELEKTNVKVTVMLTESEIEIIVGLDAPDEMVDKVFEILERVGVRDASVSGDSSTYGRQTYTRMARINGGHEHYTSW